MTPQLVAPSRLAPVAPGPTRHRRARIAAAVAIAALAGTGGYLVTTTGSDDSPATAATSADVNPSAQTLRELRASISGQYGPPR